MSNKIEIFKIPPYEIEKKGNLTKIQYFNDIQPLEMMVVAFPMGSFEEEIPGLANLTMQMLLNGTKKYSATEIAAKAEEKGIRLNTAANWDDSFFSAYCLKEHHETAAELMIECLKNPSFFEDELERQKKKTISALELKMSEPDYLSALTFLDTYFKGSKYGHPRNGTIESISKITVEDCKKFYNKLINTEMYLVASGDFDKASISKVADNLRTENDIFVRPAEDFIRPKLEYSVNIHDKKDAPQSSIIAGIPALDKLDEDYPIMQVVNTVYGGYFGSRLNQILREDKGYTYGIYSRIDSRKYTSVLKISTDADNKYVSEILPEIIRQSKIISTKPIDSEELMTAKNYILGSFLRSTETPFQVAGLLRSIHVNDFPMDYFEKYISKINNTNKDDFLRVAKRQFQGNEFTFAIAGCKEKIGEIDK
jgi:predicted Zn-dependent peptidase